MQSPSLALKERAVGLVESLQAADTSALGSRRVGFEPGSILPNSPEHRVERFAIASFICNELVDDLIVRDSGSGVEAFRFAPPLDGEVVDTPTLALWTQDIFKDAAAEHYAADGTFRKSVDRLHKIAVEPLAEVPASEMPGLAVSLQNLSPLESAVNNIGTSNFALDLDNALRRGMWAADFYDMELPRNDQLPAFARRSIAEAIPMTREPQLVQDFYDTLEDIAHTLLPRPSSVELAERRKTFKEIVGLSERLWRNGNELSLLPGKRVAGSNPKAFYRIKPDDQIGVRVELLAENIAKLVDEDTRAETIGCAVGLVKSEKFGASALQLGLRATIRAMHEIGVFDQDMHSFTEIAPYKLDGLTEFRGRTAAMGGSLLQTMLKITNLTP